MNNTINTFFWTEALPASTSLYYTLFSFSRLQANVAVRSYGLEHTHFSFYHTISTGHNAKMKSDF